MKSFELVVQEKSNFCLCSVLQAIFKKYNINISQENIASNLTPAENGFLIQNLNIRPFLNKNNFEYSSFNYNETPFNEPDMLLKSMDENEGIIGIDTHVYLLKNFSDPKLIMIDPKNSKTIVTDIYSLSDKMRKTYGFFGLIKRIS